ncbi:TauD/TfdA dioxygenase family protein [Paraburkholderia sp. USG1]|uniref:TauD/TfdA dioxygenase family protein n=1 Tax=Paraburkholderia sp. USG1 TaxID=2952268 RepID=UPI00386213D9
MSAAAVQEVQSIEVTPLSAHIGAEIHGVDLTQKLDARQIAEIRAALLKWRVVFFREQFLTHGQHVAFSAQFGELTLGHPVFGHVEGHPEVYSISKYRKATRFEGQTLQRPWTGWHTDVTAAVNPPWASILRGVTIPPYGGDTQWTNLVAAYQKLSAPLRSFVRRQSARDSPLYAAGRRERNAGVSRSRRAARPRHRASPGQSSS